MKIKYLVIFCIIFYPYLLKGQENSFGKEGWSFNAGISPVGPMISFTNGGSSVDGEIYFGFHIIDWEKNEDLINKPTSGGWMFGWNFFPKYVSKSRIKLLYGIGGGSGNERPGKNSYYSSRDWKGYWYYYNINGGARFFLSKHFSITAYGMYLFYVDDSETILNKYRQTIGTTVHENYRRVGGWLYISYSF